MPFLDLSTLVSISILNLRLMYMIIMAPLSLSLHALIGIVSWPVGRRKGESTTLALKDGLAYPIAFVCDSDLEIEYRT